MEGGGVNVVKKIVSNFKWIVLTLVILFDLLLLGLNCLAYKGVPQANATLGYLYKEGVAISPKDLETAKVYLSAAANKGNVEAACDLGQVYAEQSDYKKQVHYYLAAAMYGSQKCEVLFLKLSFADEKKAYEDLKEMADSTLRNYPSAQFMVGKRLIEGLGVSKDTKAGIAYLEKASSKKHWGASLYLAGIYIKGELLPQDIKKANELLSIKIK